jgi:peptidoglycan hydrolase-like protein with peptidoglycan-binding domain
MFAGLMPIIVQGMAMAAAGAAGDIAVRHAWEKMAKDPETSTHLAVLYVKWLQATLNLAGAQLRVDGDNGMLTEHAVRTFQKDKNLQIDGLVGVETLTELIKVVETAAGGTGTTEGTSK